MNQKLLIICILVTTSLFGQEVETSKEKQFTFSGSVDTYFRQNLDGPNGEDAIAPNTSFANLNGFALGMANVIGSFESKNGKVGAVADLVFGPRGEEAVFLSSPSSNIVNQLYVYWNVSEKVKFTFGNFNTFLGYEVISPVDNFNYSTSYMFSYGPFSHTGIKADFSLADDWSAMVAILNNTDATEFNFDNDYTLGAQLGYKDTFLNFLYGKQSGNTEATFQVDLTTGHNLSDDFYLGVNATYADTDGSAFYGVALYPQYGISDSFTLGARAEYFAEAEQGAGAIGGYDEDGDASVIALTLTGSYSIGDLTIKPELRLDSTSEPTFLDTDLEPSDSLTSFLIAGIYKF
ncbi:porin [Dokdonia sinensis]|uniref:Porin n=1 Tax=Dokdonia sinensis TaxID=2479847 RepID=A0A3M0FUY7_9FLAO|nr:porin [Dokdonia sinensis]RMB56318.1 porin [Dokdonia sinensis]